MVLFWSEDTILVHPYLVHGEPINRFTPLSFLSVESIVSWCIYEIVEFPFFLSCISLSLSLLHPNHIFEEDELHVTKEEVIDIQPESILQTRIRTLRNRSMNEYLIKWLEYPTDDATWEREESLLENYPDFLSR